VSNKRKHHSLTILILVGLVVGIIVGQLLYDPTFNPEAAEATHAHAGWLHFFRFLGFTVFMNLLKMLIIPLVVTSVVVSVTGLGDFHRVGKLGGIALLYYFSTMFVAVLLGVAVVQLFKPGLAMLGQLEAVPEMSSLPIESEQSLLGVFENLVSLMIPENIFQAFSSGQTLSAIVFSIFFGVVITLLGERAKVLKEVFDALFDVLIRMVELVMLLAPVGVGALLAWTIARVGLGVFGEAIGIYMLTVIVGLVIHSIVVLPSTLYLITRVNPLRFLKQMRAALMTALGTSSSTATLPVTIECATEEDEISEEVAGLVLPLGSTINMDGTALYEAVAVIFIAQAYGIELSMMQLFIVAITATLAAIGAAGIPSAGLVTMVIVIEAVNQSLGASGSAIIPLAGIGAIIGVDRLLDMLRTTVNVWGDSIGARIVQHFE